MKQQIQNIVLVFILLLSFLKANNCIEGYNLKDSAEGVELCVKGNVSVQIINLNKGATLKFLYDKVDGQNKYKMQKMETYWNKFKKNKYAFSVVNGSYFNVYDWEKIGKNYNAAKTAQFHYLLKDYNDFIEKGANSTDKSRLFLGINSNCASTEGNNMCATMENYNLTSHAYHSIITGKKTTSIDYYINKGRNIVGVNKNNTIIYILISDKLSIKNGKEILIDFGADPEQIMLLDGSGSSQLQSKKYKIIGNDEGGRKIPQAIGILAGKKDFSDIETLSDNHQQAIRYLSHNYSLFNGNNGKFGVGKSIMRYEFLKIIIKLKEDIMEKNLKIADKSEMEKKYIDLEGIDNSSGTSKNIPSWFTDNYVLKVLGEKILQGEKISPNSKKFKLTPTRNMKYWELYKIIVKTFNISTKEDKVWGLKYYKALNKYGIDNGEKKNISVKREDVALILYRAIRAWEGNKIK